MIKLMKDEVLEYLGERRDFYKRQQRNEESKNSPNKLEAMYKKQAFDEAIYYISFIIDTY